MNRWGGKKENYVCFEELCFCTRRRHKAENAKIRMGLQLEDFEKRHKGKVHRREKLEVKQKENEDHRNTC